MYRFLSIMIVFCGVIVLVIAGCNKEKRRVDESVAIQAIPPQQTEPKKEEDQKTDANAGAEETANAKIVLENPAGLIWLRSAPAKLLLTKSEVTVAQYRACVEAGKCSAPETETKSGGEYCNWGYAERDGHPVDCVDWNQASAFCGWAGGRLPTENEWYAEASNGGSRKYPWGDAEVTCDYAVMSQGGFGCGKDSTWPVCSKERGNSISGLCDMSGNVWEWTSTSEGSVRVVRGGSWDGGNPDSLRASARGRVVPTLGDYYYGFRCGRPSQ